MLQKTINKSISLSGIGLHTGKNSNIIIKPSYDNTGIIFKNVKDSYAIIADVNNVLSTNRGTTLYNNNNNKIYTIEHLLSALNSFGIDNVIIEMDSIEVPIMDGSCKDFVEEIKNVGIKELNAEKEYINIDKIIEIKDDNSDTYIKVEPYDGFKVTCEIEFANSSIGHQKYSLESLDLYNNEVSKCRTFCTFNEISYMQDKGLIKGGNLDNALIFNNNNSNDDIIEFNKKNSIEIPLPKSNQKLLNNKELLYDNECARHKVLDLIGDIALLGKPIRGHIISYKAGHSQNIELAKKINSTYIKNKTNNTFYYNKEEIKSIIPHRDPFLLIDEIIGGEMGKYVFAVKNVSKKEEYFKGHFPGNPIMPGVLIIECMAQTSCFLSLSNVDEPDQKLMLLTSIRKARFMNKVKPGDRMILRVELIKYKMRNAIIKGEAYVNNKIVATAEWMATVVNRYEN